MKFALVSALVVSTVIAAETYNEPTNNPTANWAVINNDIGPTVDATKGKLITWTNGAKVDTSLDVHIVLYAGCGQGKLTRVKTIGDGSGYISGSDKIPVKQGQFNWALTGEDIPNFPTYGLMIRDNETTTPTYQWSIPFAIDFGSTLPTPQVCGTGTLSTGSMTAVPSSSTQTQTSTPSITMTTTSTSKMTESRGAGKHQWTSTADTSSMTNTTSKPTIPDSGILPGNDKKPTDDKSEGGHGKAPPGAVWDEECGCHKNTTISVGIYQNNGVAPKNGTKPMDYPSGPAGSTTGAVPTTNNAGVPEPTATMTPTSSSRTSNAGVANPTGGYSLPAGSTPSDTSSGYPISSIASSNVFSMALAAFAAVAVFFTL